MVMTSPSLNGTPANRPFRGPPPALFCWLVLILTLRLHTVLQFFHGGAFFARLLLCSSCSTPGIGVSSSCRGWIISRRFQDDCCGTARMLGARGLLESTGSPARHRGAARREGVMPRDSARRSKLPVAAPAFSAPRWRSRPRGRVSPARRRRRRTPRRQITRRRRPTRRAVVGSSTRCWRRPRRTRTWRCCCSTRARRRARATTRRWGTARRRPPTIRARSASRACTARRSRRTRSGRCATSASRARGRSAS